MIVDFQHHFVPPALLPEGATERPFTRFDADGVPSYSFHALLVDLDAHIEMMDAAGIGAAVLSCAEGMCAPADRSVICNDAASQAARAYPGRFIGTAHVHPLGGQAAMTELRRCAEELGFPGVVITSEFDGLTLDAPQLDPFWEEVVRLGIYVFVHPALRLAHPGQFDAYDLARAVGREFSLVQATVRLINGGVFDRHPGLTVQMAHLGGGIASVLGRIRSYQDRDFWGTAGNDRHGRNPERGFDTYLAERMVFDTAGFCGDARSVRTSLVELPAERIVFASDYPQEIRAKEDVRAFVEAIAGIPDAGAAILGGNNHLLLP